MSYKNEKFAAGKTYVVQVLVKQELITKNIFKKAGRIACQKTQISV